MQKLWTLIWHEYTRHVLRRRFLFALLSVPLWIVVMIGMGILSVLLQTSSNPVGYVDQAGLMTVNSLPYQEEPELGDVTFVPYASEAEAVSALQAKQIQAYFVLPENYRSSLMARLVYLEPPGSQVTGQFRRLLRANLLAGQPENVARRITEGPELVIEAVQENRTARENDLFNVFAPIVAGILLIVAVFTSSGYLMQAVVEEKENRTIEILATSLSPAQIMSGKIIALISVGLTQVSLWSLFPLAAILLAGPYLPFLENVNIDWALIGMIFLTILPTFVLISALMAAIGATVTEAREGQQVSALVTMPVMAPYMLMSVLMFNPGGTLALILSFFPLTAALTLLIRMGFSTVPLWQTLVSVGFLILSAVGALWLAGRLFRLGMLSYGKRLGWRDVGKAIRSRPQEAA